MMLAVLARYSDAIPIARDVLRDDGWDVLTFADDRTLASTMPFQTPDLILIDVGSYEGEIGWEMVTRLKGQPALASVPVVVSSDDAFDLRNHLDRLQEGVAAVLVQPCSPGDVHRCVTAVTQGSGGGPGGAQSVSRSNGTS